MYQFVRSYVKKAPEKVIPTTSKVSDELTSKNPIASTTTASTSISDTTSGTEIGSKSLHTSSGSSCKVTHDRSDSSGNLHTSSQTWKPSQENPFANFELKSAVSCSKALKLNAQFDTKESASLSRHDERPTERNPKIHPATVDKESRGHSKEKHRPKRQTRRLPSFGNSCERLNLSSNLDGAQVNRNTLENQLQKVIPVPPFIPTDRKVYFEAEMFAEGQKLDAKLVKIEPNDEIFLDVVDKTFQMKYNQLTMLMKTYYSTTLVDPRQERIPQDEIKPGMIAVAVIYPRTVHAAFIRSKVLNMTHAYSAGKSCEMVTISGVDNGEVYIIPPQNLCYIDEEFLKVPFKMQQCKLNGLEFFHGAGMLKKMLRKFLNVNSIAKATFSGSSTNVEIDLFTRIGQHEQPVNLLLFQELMGHFTPVIPEDEFIQVVLSHCDTDGSVWVQASNGMLPKIISFCSKFEDKMWKLEARSIDLIAEDVLRGELHVVKSNGSYFRAKILEIFFDKNRAAVEFVDWGKREVVPLDFVYRATDIDPNFGKLAPQALKIYVDCFKGCDLETLMQGQTMNIREISSESKSRTGVVTCVGYVLLGEAQIPLEAFIRQLTSTSRARRHF